MEETKRNWSTHDFYYDLPKEDALILTKYYTEEAAQ